MAKDREIACVSYVCEGTCKKGRAGTFRDACQTCDKYVAVRGGAPARTDTRRAKVEKQLNKEIKRGEY